MPESEPDRMVDDGKLQRHDFYKTRDLTSDYFQVMREKSRPVWCKIQWFIITMAFLTVTVYMVYRLLKSYLKYESYDSVSLEWVSQLALPAITICNVNPMDYTSMKKNYNATVLAELIEYAAEIKKYSGIDMAHFNTDETLETMKQLDAEFVAGDADIFRENVYDIQDFIVGDGNGHPVYTFAGQWMSESGIKQVSHYYGKCIELNSEETLVQTVAGPKGGLTIDLDVKTDTYMPITPHSGLMVYLRSLNETVVLDNEGIFITPGSETSISLQKYSVKRLKPRVGQCDNVTSDFIPSAVQTVRECSQGVWLKMVVRLCECVPWYLIDKLEELGRGDALSGWVAMAFTDKEEEENDINVDQLEGVDEDEYMCGYSTAALCDARVLDKFRNVTWLTTVGSENYSIECKEPCQYEDYEYDTIATTFPVSETYFNSTLFYLDQARGLNFSYTQNNLVRINIFYDQLKTTKVEQVAAYEFFNFVAELGGTVDLLIGFSFFTCFQLLEIGLAVIIFRCCRRGGPELPPPHHHDRRVVPGRRQEKKAGDFVLTRSDQGMFRMPDSFLGIRIGD